MLIQLFDNNGNIEKINVGDFNIICKEKELFKLLISDENGSTLNITSGCFNIVNKTAEDDKIYITYSGRNQAEGIEISVSLLTSETEAKWEFEVKNSSDKTVEKIYYPCINAKNCLVDEGGEYKVFLPCFEGAEITKVSDTPGDEKEYPGF